MLLVPDFARRRHSWRHPRNAFAGSFAKADGHPENITFEGRPMWQSYRDTAATALKALALTPVLDVVREVAESPDGPWSPARRLRGMFSTAPFTEHTFTDPACFDVGSAGVSCLVAPFVAGVVPPPLLRPAKGGAFPRTAFFLSALGLL
jgi:hypothetical protein